MTSSVNSIGMFPKLFFLYQIMWMLVDASGCRGEMISNFSLVYSSISDSIRKFEFCWNILRDCNDATIVTIGNDNFWMTFGERPSDLGCSLYNVTNVRAKSKDCVYRHAILKTDILNKIGDRTYGPENYRSGNYRPETTL